MLPANSAHNTGKNKKSPGGDFLSEMIFGFPGRVTYVLYKC